MSDLQTRRLELLQQIKHKDRRTKHFMKDKHDAENLVCLFILDDHFQLSLFASHEHWPNLHKISENTFVKLMKISMKWRRKLNLTAVFWSKRVEYLSIDVICNRLFVHETLSCIVYSFRVFFCTHSTVCFIGRKP